MSSLPVAAAVPSVPKAGFRENDYHGAAPRVRAVFLFRGTDRVKNLLMPTAGEWDKRFSRGDHVCTTPDPFFGKLASYYPLLPQWKVSPENPARGLRALDLACGSGRHAVSLAQIGFQTTAVDFSEQALTCTHRLAVDKGVTVDCRLEDIEAKSFQLSQELYDLAAVLFFLHRPLFPVLRDCLRSGGLIIYKTYSTDQLRYPGRPSSRMHMLAPNELLRFFVGFRVLRYEEEWEGRGTAALIAQKI